LGEKTRETIFPEKHELFKQKCWEKNVPKGGKKRFLNSHEYRDEKMGGWKCAKQFLQKHTNGSSKNVGKKIVAI